MIMAKKAECEAIELWEQLEKLNVKVKSLECGNELVRQQETFSSHSLKMEQLQ